MKRTRISLAIFLLIAASGIRYSLSVTVSFAGESLNSTRETTGSILDLLKEEVLDTVSLGRPIHFITPAITDTVVEPGLYQVFVAGDNQLKLVEPNAKHAVLVDALSTNHDEDVAVPIALFVQDDDKFPHIVLLLPQGKGLEAVGSYDASRSRSVQFVRLTPVQIRTAFRRKVPQTPPTPPGVPIPYPVSPEEKGSKPE